MTKPTRPQIKHWFANKLLAWFDQHGRHDLPWQAQRTPYRVWISEIMLQQTQVVTVIPYFNRFMKRFPDLLSLANAEQDLVLAHWSGLGYYARARNLHAAAKQCVRDFNSALPPTLAQLEQLPGIGRSTAAAIVAQAFAQRAVILDGNVKRVLARFHAIDTPITQTQTLQRLWDLADLQTPALRSADYTQAIMDLGAMLCTARKPSCAQCPIRARCQAQLEHRTDEIPQKKSTKQKPERQMVFLVRQNSRGEIWLKRRANHGIWGGLFCFDEFADAKFAHAHARALARTQERHVKQESQVSGSRNSHSRQTDSFDRHQSLEKNVVRETVSEYCSTSAKYRFQIQKRPTIKHALTHFNLRIEVLLMQASNARESVSEAAKLSRDSMQDGQWLSLEHALQIGLPQPVRAIIESIKHDASQKS